MAFNFLLGTFRQNIFGTDILIPNYLQSKDILPGIKVDTGAHNSDNTLGLKSNQLLTKTFHSLFTRM